MQAGEIYYKDLGDHTIFRRIVAIHGGVVCYSRGSDTNGLCKIETFRKWANNKKVRVESCSCHYSE